MPRRQTLVEDDHSGRPAGGSVITASSLKTPTKPKNHLPKSADAYARNFNSTRRSTQKGDYLDGPPSTMPETYTVQSKRPLAEDRSQPIIVPADFFERHNLNTSTPTPSENSIGIRRVKTHHGPKPALDPFLVHDRQKKRYVSLAATTDSKTKTPISDEGYPSMGDVCKTLFEKELAERSRVSKRRLEGESVKLEFEPLPQKIKSEVSIANQAADENDLSSNSVLNSDLKTNMACDYPSVSGHCELPVSQKRRKLSSRHSTTTATTIDDLKIENVQFAMVRVEVSAPRHFKVEDTDAKGNE